MVGVSAVPVGLLCSTCQLTVSVDCLVHSLLTKLWQYLGSDDWRYVGRGVE